jgi:glycosyltransferase involved in cell wall biosynthesis
MKMLFVSAGIPSSIGQIHLFNLLRGLGGAHDVRVICFDDPGHPRVIQRQDVPWHRNTITVPLVQKHIIRKALTSAFRGTPIAVETYRSRDLADAVLHACRRESFDVVVVEQLALGQYFPLVRHTSSILFPVDAVSRLKGQRCQAVANPLARAVHELDHRMTEQYERRVYRQFDGIMFVSGADARYVVDAGQVDASRVHVLPNGVDLEYFHPGAPHAEGECPSLVFLGNMQNHINEHAVLWFSQHVWPTLRRTVPDLRFSIIGSNPSDQLRQSVAGDPRVVVVGYQEDVRPHTWNATLFVSPLQMGTGIKNRMLQAMAMGKAIVASPLSVEGMDVRNGEHLRVARDADAFVREIHFLLDRPDERMRLSCAARRYVELHHSLEGAASKFLDIILRVRNTSSHYAHDLRRATIETR